MFFAGVPRWLWNLFSPSVTKKTSFPSHTSSIIPLPWYHAFWLTSSPIPISSNIPGLCLTLNKPKSIRDNLHHESPVTILLRRDVKVAISTWSASRLKTGSWFSWEGGWCYHLEDPYLGELSRCHSVDRDLPELPAAEKLGNWSSATTYPWWKKNRSHVIQFFWGRNPPWKPTLESSLTSLHLLCGCLPCCHCHWGSLSLQNKLWHGWVLWIWVFPKLGVPQNGWFIMENPIKKLMIWGYHHFRKHPYWHDGKKTPQPHGAYSLLSALHTFRRGMICLRKTLDPCVNSPIYLWKSRNSLQYIFIPTYLYLKRYLYVDTWMWLGEGIMGIVGHVWMQEGFSGSAESFPPNWH